MKSREDLLNEARQNIKEMTVQEVNALLEKGESPVLLDIRELDEWDLGHLKDAIHIPRGKLEALVEDRIPDKSAALIVYCAGGVRSLLAGETLRAMGYEDLISMEGGYGDWEDAGLEAEIPPPPEEETSVGDAGLLETEIEHLEKVLANRKERLAKAAK